MKQNVGKIDAAVRIVVGLLLLSLVFVLEGATRWFGLIGALPLVTGLVGHCPMYIPFHIDTHEHKLTGGTGH